MCCVKLSIRRFVRFEEHFCEVRSEYGIRSSGIGMFKEIVDGFVGLSDIFLGSVYFDFEMMETEGEGV